MMNKRLILALFLMIILGACGSGTPTLPPTQDVYPTALPVSSSEATQPGGATETVIRTTAPIQTNTPGPSLTPDAAQPPDEVGPTNFPPGVNPLTGLMVSDSSRLERHPIAVKVSNYPRNNRPQWGLSLADIVYEYYHEGGLTRFFAVFYGNDAEMVGPIRSARFFDQELIPMYQVNFAFAGADPRVLNRLGAAAFAGRLVTELDAGCPPMCRYDPTNMNHLVTNTQDIDAFILSRGIENSRQNLDGMFFMAQAPPGGVPVRQLYIRYSFGDFLYWDYNASTGRYLRYQDAESDNGQGEVFEPLSDRLTSAPIAADNVVVLMIPHSYYSVSPEMIEFGFDGVGTAYAFRDGQVYTIQWRRQGENMPLSLTFLDGTPYPLKPGTTWFQVLGTSSNLTEVETLWRFTFSVP